MCVTYDNSKIRQYILKILHGRMHSIYGIAYFAKNVSYEH
jgi:hypothetical protein